LEIGWYINWNPLRQRQLLRQRWYMLHEVHGLSPNVSRTCSNGKCHKWTHCLRQAAGYSWRPNLPLLCWQYFRPFHLCHFWSWASLSPIPSSILTVLLYCTTYKLCSKCMHCNFLCVQNFALIFFSSRCVTYRLFNVMNTS
jgi:hypothetical protein